MSAAPEQPPPPEPGTAGVRPPRRMKLTQTKHVGATAHARVFEGGFTFRLAKGDTHVAVFVGVYVEQRRYLVLRDRTWPGPVLDQSQPIAVALPKPKWLDWADTDSLAGFARSAVPVVRARLASRRTR